MKSVFISILLAFSSTASACAGSAPCHDGPPRVGDLFGGNGPASSRPHQARPLLSKPKKPNFNVNKFPKFSNKYPSMAGSAVKERRDLYEILEVRGYFDDEFEEEYVLPSLPCDANPYAQHIFVRLNTIPKAYPPVGEVDHSGLNKLMHDLGGQHVDFVYGNPAGYKQCGMNLVDMEWTQTHSNADGYPVFAQCSELWPGRKDKYTYIGELDGHNISRLSHEILSGETYDHKSFHCATFVVLMLRILGFLPS